VINQWLDRRAQERRQEMHALREVRTPLYRKLILPWATALAAARAGKDPVQALAGSADSPEYQLALFEFAMTASDDLVRSFSRLMLAASLSKDLPEAAKEVIDRPESVMGDFILQLRKDLGPQGTNLERDDVIRVLFHHLGNSDISEVLRDTAQASVRERISSDGPVRTSGPESEP
jgi:hypothetical protein